jgi:hypothetical protein
MYLLNTNQPSSYVVLVIHYHLALTAKRKAGRRAQGSGPKDTAAVHLLSNILPSPGCLKNAVPQGWPTPRVNSQALRLKLLCTTIYYFHRQNAFYVLKLTCSCVVSKKISYIEAGPITMFLEGRQLQDARVLPHGRATVSTTQISDAVIPKQNLAIIWACHSRFRAGSATSLNVDFDPVACCHRAVPSARASVN